MKIKVQEAIKTCSQVLFYSITKGWGFLKSNAKVYPGDLKANEKLGHFRKIKLSFPYCRLLNHAFTSEHVPSLKCSICWVASFFKKNLKYKYASRERQLGVKIWVAKQEFYCFHSSSLMKCKMSFAFVTCLLTHWLYLAINCSGKN